MRILDLKLSCVVLLYYTQTISSDGPYMNPFRHGRNGTTGAKIEFTDPEPILDLFSLQNANLAAVDRQYSRCNDIDIREISILEIQEHFRTNKLNSVALTDCYLKRIHHMNRVLHAVIEINPDAIAQARAADLERLSYGPRGYMHGIPILLKDNIDTFDKTETTAGSLALLGIRPKRDADVVELLWKAGVVIIGKSNLSEFANFRGTNIPNGWSGRGNQTLNPYNFHEDPSGSSTGSAVGVASNLVSVAVGTETDGSLITPANKGGICTIKSTLGLISTQGVIPISHSQDTVGPFARTMMDLTILFDAMVSEQVKNRHACEGSYVNCLLQREPKKSFRIGVLRYPFWDLSAINSTFLAIEIPQLNAIIKTMDDLPIFNVVDPVAYAPDMLENGISGSDELTVMLHEFKHGINKYLEEDVISPYSFPPQTPIKRIASLKDIIQFNIDHPSPEGYNQQLLTLSEATDGLNNPTYIEALQTNRGSARRLLDYVIGKFSLDAIVAPAESKLRTDVESLDDVPLMANSVAAIAGYPSVVVPAGIGYRGVPFGINFIGRPYTEAKLLQIAYEVEHITRKRVPPQFLV